MFVLSLLIELFKSNFKACKSHLTLTAGNDTVAVIAAPGSAYCILGESPSDGNSSAGRPLGLFGEAAPLPAWRFLKLDVGERSWSVLPPFATRQHAPRHFSDT